MAKNEGWAIANGRVVGIALLSGVERFAKLAGFLLLLLVAACYHAVEVAPPVTVLQRAPEVTSASGAPRAPAYVSSITVSTNVPGAASADDLRNQVMTKLKETGVFTDVIYAAYGSEPKDFHYIVEVKCKEERDAHMGGNMAKAFFIGFTLFLLTPALPMSYDYLGDCIVNVRDADRFEKTYTASCTASGVGTIGWKHAEAITEADTKGRESCVNSVISQMAADPSLRRAGDAGPAPTS